MKFGKYLQQHVLPEWSFHYINYKGLKKIIKKAEANSNDAQTFFYSLDRELEKVNSFYVEKESELKTRFRLLQGKKQIMTEKSKMETVLNLHEAFMQFQHELIKLQNFVEMNATGFRKILKKFDRRTKATTKELYLSSHVEVQPCFNREVLVELSDHAATMMSELDGMSKESDRQLTFEQWIQSVDHLEIDLMNAIKNNDVEQTGILSKKILALEGSIESEWLQRAFRKACAYGSVSCARLFLDLGTEVTCVDDVSGRSCFHFAAMNGHLEILKLLVEYDEKQKRRVMLKRDSNGNSKDISESNEDIDLVQNKVSLLELDLEDMSGRRPLHYAAMRGFSDCVRFLLEKGAKDSLTDQDGSIPLVLAVIKGHVKCVQEFLEHETKTLSIETGKDPLALAAEYGHSEIVEILIKNGCDVNKLNLSGIAPLHLSAREGHVKCCEILTNSGADLMLVDKYNQWTPIFYAAAEGHIECAKVLLASGKCKLDVFDDAGWTPWQHALFSGHIETAELLKLPQLEQDDPMNTTKEKEEVPKNKDVEEMDAIPTLELPPPMIPCKIYGHHYLDKKIQIRIHLGTPNYSYKRAPLKLFDSRQTSSLKLNIRLQRNGGIPHTVILPLEDDQELFTFEVDSLDNLTLQFDVLPTFGSKAIGRAIALPSMFQSSLGKITTPVFDKYDLTGEICFEYVIINPFSHPLMSISGKIQTYWKSTSTVISPSPGLSLGKGKPPTSIVTASSLAQEYLLLTVQVTKDGIPVIYDKGQIENVGFDLTISDITFAQFLNLSQQDLEKKREIVQQGNPSSIHQIHVSLSDLLKFLPSNIGICLDVRSPAKESHLTLFNEYVEIILSSIYNFAGNKNLILSSIDPTICLMLNLKQPNYPVFFQTFAGLKKWDDARCNSINNGINFSKSANFLGIICEATPLVQVPDLISTIKSAGLLLATFGPANAIESNITLQEKFGVDAILNEGILRVKRHSEWN